MALFSLAPGFLEEAFLAYLMGAEPKKGRPLKRYVLPPDTRTAITWLKPDGAEYAKWHPQVVSMRSTRYFRGGRPFKGAVDSRQSKLAELQTLRNAIAHDSASARDKFHVIARRHLGSLPPDITVGSFLLTTITTAPPQSFFEHYMKLILEMAEDIAPM